MQSQPRDILQALLEDLYQHSAQLKKLKNVDFQSFSNVSDLTWKQRGCELGFPFSLFIFEIYNCRKYSFVHKLN